MQRPQMAWEMLQMGRPDVIGKWSGRVYSLPLRAHAVVADAAFLAVGSGLQLSILALTRSAPVVRRCWCRRRHFEADHSCWDPGKCIRCPAWYRSYTMVFRRRTGFYGGDKPHTVRQSVTNSPKFGIIRIPQERLFFADMIWYQH